MGASTPNEVAPPYEEVYSRPSRSTTGYTRITTTDEPDLERNTAHHHHDAPPAAAAPATIEMNESRPNPSYPTEYPHTHCEECDRQLERREARRSRDQCCATVSRTMMTMALFLMMFGIVAVICAKAKRPN